MSAHPYAPAGLDLAGYVPLRLSRLEILAVYLGASLSVLLSVWLISGRCLWISKATACSGAHVLVGVHRADPHPHRGPLRLHPDFFAKGSPRKEYSKGDSRYVARDTATVNVEGITAVLEGPASLLAVYANATRRSYNHILQFAVYLGQLYGCLVYFITAYLHGFNFWASPFYFWAYFIGANSSWVVIPMLITTRSWKNICAAIHESEKVKTK